MVSVRRLWQSQPAKAFEALVRPHLAALYRVAYRYTQDPAEAEDLLQDLLVKLYEKRTELFAVDQPRPWMVRALRHLAIDRWRRHRNHPASVETLTEGQLEAALAASLPGSPSPESDAERADATAQLQAALARLSEEHRSVILLHDVEGFTLQELEIVLEAPLGTLKSRLHRARNRLRELLRDATFSEPDACNG